MPIGTWIWVWSLDSKWVVYQRRISIVLVDNSLREDHYCFPQAMKVIPIKRKFRGCVLPWGWGGYSTGSEQRSPLQLGKHLWQRRCIRLERLNVSTFIRVFPYVPNLQDPILFQSRLLLSTLKDWKFRFLCNSVTEWDSAFDFQEFQPLGYRKQRSPSGHTELASDFVCVCSA